MSEQPVYWACDEECDCGNELDEDALEHDAMTAWVEIPGQPALLTFAQVCGWAQADDE